MQARHCFLTCFHTCFQVAKLRGHSDCVRSLAVSSHGKVVLSGSSDGTLKLWDIGMCRCVHTYKLHSDSVWCLLPSADCNTVYSGGRDGCVFRTNLPARSAELLVREDRAVRSLALDAAASVLWTSTDRTTASKWELDRAVKGVLFPGDGVLLSRCF